MKHKRLYCPLVRKKAFVDVFVWWKLQEPRMFVGCSQQGLIASRPPTHQRQTFPRSSTFHFNLCFSAFKFVPLVHYTWVITISNYENWLKGVEVAKACWITLARFWFRQCAEGNFIFFITNIFFIGSFYDSLSWIKCKWDKRFFWSAFGELRRNGSISEAPLSPRACLTAKICFEFIFLLCKKDPFSVGTPMTYKVNVNCWIFLPSNK